MMIVSAPADRNHQIHAIKRLSSKDGCPSTNFMYTSLSAIAFKRRRRDHEKLAAGIPPMAGGRQLKISGGVSSGETPVPIPNTAVKSAAPMILGWLRPGKAGTARVKKALEKSRAFFLACFFLARLQKFLQLEQLLSTARQIEHRRHERLRPILCLVLVQRQP